MTRYYINLHGYSWSSRFRYNRVLLYLFKSKNFIILHNWKILLLELKYVLSCYKRNFGLFQFQPFDRKHTHLFLIYNFYYFFEKGKINKEQQKTNNWLIK